MKAFFLFSLLSAGAWAHTHQPATYSTKEILTDSNLLRAVGIPALESDESIGVSIARITPEDELKISRKAHEWGRCGGFESLAEDKILTIGERFSALQSLRTAVALRPLTAEIPERLQRKDPIVKALAQVDPANLRTWVEWFSNYPTRHNKGANANNHVIALQGRIQEILNSGTVPATVELITHSSTPQKSIRVRLPGKTRPDEIIVLGGHMDSINQMDFWSPGSSRAPGADDNASGSSNLLEALRILVKQEQAERTIEFFWYAGEESGLLGSGEIATTYKRNAAQVIAVLQLDMTLYPGDGEFVLASMTDFTSPWLRNVVAQLSGAYLNVRIVEDKCGYGCSDHASWFRQGYPTVMPFEATFRNMNHDIHTERDTITDRSNFRHSAVFTQIALALAMELGNSTDRQHLE